MCGICGVVYADPDRRVEPELLYRMANTMRHRGPDDDGFYVKGNVGLGMRRLSIIDLAGGKQPISNEAGDVWVVLNGEIYNFQELKETLEKKHSFRTKTDTEVIVHLYEEYGDGCLERLRGMFAFALWDEKKRRLLLARDRAGKKPLNYSLSSSGLSFSSEINSLLNDPDVDRGLDLESVDLYLSWQFIPHPWSIYRGVRKLPPAHYMVLEGGKAEIKRYWQLDYSMKADITEDEAKAEVLRLLDDAVRLRMISDVPLGALLSGGIDSSAVVALMAAQSTAKISTFSIGFEEEKYNELPYAREVASYIGTDHHELVVKPDIEGLLDRLPEIYGEPFADKSAIPSYYLCGMTRRHVTVALNGDGGDEAFAGYGKYLQRSFMSDAPAAARSTLYGMLSGGSGSAGRVKSKLMKKLLPHTASVHYSEFFEGYRKAALYKRDYARKLSNGRLEGVIRYLDEGSAGCTNQLDRMLSIDFNHYLPGDLLVKMDIASMANSLEVRSPFLDHKLLEFCATLPPGMLVKAGKGKHILREAFKGRLPEGIIDRGKKGFSIPVQEWLKTSLRKKTEHVLGSSPLIREHFDGRYVGGLISEHVSGRKNHAMRLWALLILGIWDMKRPS